MSDAVHDLVSAGERGELSALSKAYDTTQLTGEQAAEAASLIGEHPSADQYLLLLALQRDAPDMYERVPADTRAAVIAGALGKLKSLNDFGYLEPRGGYDDVLGDALIELGEPAARALRPLLDDRTDAVLEDSEAATLSSMYRYRRADFAYRYASLALGKDARFHKDVAQRDADIEKLKAELDSSYGS